MSINDYINLLNAFSKDDSLIGYFIKLNGFINVSGHLRREFYNCRNVHFDSDENIYFSVEDWTTFKDIELCINRRDIEKFVPSKNKSSDANKSDNQPVQEGMIFKEGFIDYEHAKRNSLKFKKRRY